MLALPRVLRHPDLAKGTLVSLTVQGGGLVLGYVAQVLLARWLGEEGFGVYSLVLTWAALLGLVAALGWPDTFVRFLPTADRGRSAGLLRAGFVSASAAGLLAAGVGLAVRPSEPSLATAFGIGLWLVPMLAVGHLLSARARTRGRAVLALAPNSVVRPVGTALIVAIASLVGAPSGAQAVLAAGGAILVGVSWQAFSLDLPLSDPIFEVRKWARVATPIWLFSIMGIATERADLLIVGAYLPIEDVAAYGAAVATAMVVLLFLLAAEVLAGPRFAAANTPKELEGLVRETTRLGFWPALATTVAFVLFGREILGLFGPEFARAHSALIILSLGRLISATFGSVVLVLNVTGHQDDNLKAFAVIAPTSVAVGLVVVPNFGMLGAATVTALTLAAWNTWLHVVVRRRLGISTLPY